MKLNKVYLKLENSKIVKCKLIKVKLENRKMT